MTWIWMGLGGRVERPWPRECEGGGSGECVNGRIREFMREYLRGETGYSGDKMEAEEKEEGEFGEGDGEGKEGYDDSEADGGL